MVPRLLTCSWCLLSHSLALLPPQPTQRTAARCLQMSSDVPPSVRRRTVVSSVLLVAPSAQAASTRAMAYLVDSTIPPSLLPLSPSRQRSVVAGLGRGGGTRKVPFFQDELNFNNVMNKLVLGTADLLLSPTAPSAASFLFLGGSLADTPTAQLALALIRQTYSPSTPTAIGLAFVPLPLQPALDAFLSSSTSLETLEAVLRQGGASPTLTQQTLPIFQFAHQHNLPLLALSPTTQELETIRQRGPSGLESIDADQKQTYIADTVGFVNGTRDKRFQLYTEKSLLTTTTTDEPSTLESTFAERILVHEAAATIVARWAVAHARSLVIVLAPVEDVRFMEGMNGRVRRIYSFLQQANDGEERTLGEEAVTTILLNPTAENTLSQSKFLRLEINTAPENWEYQTKVADYLWFSTMPKVNMLPRMMNEI